MIFTASNWQDIRRYYEGTWVKFQELGERLCKIGRVNVEKKAGYDENGNRLVFLAGSVNGVDEDGEPFILYLDDENPYDMTFTLPTHGIFPYNGTVYELRRIPARQYQRGISSNNTSIREIFTQEAKEINVALLKSFVNKPTYTPIVDAITGKYPKKVVGFHVGHRMSFYRLDQSLWIDSLRVAFFDRDKDCFKMLKGCQHLTKEVASLGKPVEGASV